MKPGLLPSLAFAAFALAACGGGGGGGGQSVPIASPTPANTANVTFSLNLGLSTQSVERRPAFVSPSTSSIVVAVSGQTATGNCSAGICSVQLTVPVGLDSFTISLYDKPNGAGTLLGIGKASVNIVAGSSNTIKASYDGVLDHVVAVPAATSVPAGTATTISVAINGYDPDGNLIVGPNAFIDVNGSPVTLTLSRVDTSAGGRGTTQLSQTTVTSPTTVSVAYNGLAMYQSDVSIQSSSQLRGTLVGCSIAFVPTIKEYDVAPYLPTALTPGPDGNVWMTDLISNVVKITPAGAVSGYSVGAGNTGPDAITVGSDGNLWFSEFTGQQIGKVTTAGQVTLYQPFAATGYGDISGIFKGPDGNFWVGEGASEITKITPDGLTATAYTLTTYANPGNLTSGPNGGLLFTEATSPDIGTITTSGVISEYATADGAASWGATMGPDGNIWYTQPTEIIKANPNFSTLGRYAISAKGGGIIPGPDGNLWFVESYGNKIGRVTPQGVVTEFSVPTAYAQQPQPALAGITVGPDGNIWFGEQINRKVGVLIY